MKNIFLIISLIFVLPSLIFSQNSASLLVEGSAPLIIKDKGTVLMEAKPEEAGMSSERLARLDQHIEKFVADGIVPGGVFMIARKGKTIYYKNFGHTSLDKSSAYKKDDIFRLASMTKAFTTVGIMQLYERGMLGLDDPIMYYIPAFATAQVLDQYNEADTTFTSTPTNRPITVRHLLTHTSGITYGSFNPGKIEAIYTKVGANGFGLSHHSMNTGEMADQIAKAPLIFQPGEKYMYGLNMEVLGRIIEVVSGMPLNQYFKENIFDPLSLEDTRFYLPPSKHDRLVPVFTMGQDGVPVMASDTEFGEILKYPMSPDNNHYAGGGGLSGTAMDYAVFIQALLNDGKYPGGRLLSRKSIDVMTSDQMISLNQKGTGYSKIPGITFGLGFALVTDEGQAASHKSPGTYEWGGVFNTKFFIDQEEDLIFVGMTQIVPFSRPDFWSKMYAIIYGAIED